MRSVFGPNEPNLTAIETQRAADAKSNKSRTDAPHERKMTVFGAQNAQENSSVPQKPLCFGCKQ